MITRFNQQYSRIQPGHTHTHICGEIVENNLFTEFLIHFFDFYRIQSENFFSHKNVKQMSLVHDNATNSNAHHCYSNRFFCLCSVFEEKPPFSFSLNVSCPSRPSLLPLPLSLSLALPPPPPRLSLRSSLSLNHRWFYFMTYATSKSRTHKNCTINAWLQAITCGSLFIPPVKLTQNLVLYPCILHLLYCVCGHATLNNLI